MRLKELRKERGKTQQEIADMLNISRVQYTNIENGIRETSFGTLKKLAGYFSVTCDYLLSLSDIPNPCVTADELSLIAKFRLLPPEKRRAIEALLD